jgi:hypothetical protein
VWYNRTKKQEVEKMSLEEFKSFKRSITVNTVKFNRGKLSKEEYYENMVAILGIDTFEETIKIIDEPKPK